MEKRTETRISTKVIWVPGAIVGSVFVAYLVGLFIAAWQQPNNAVLMNMSANVATNAGLAILGIAVSVWIGLNIYNVLSKQEMNLLLEKANEAIRALEGSYKELFCSKLRTSTTMDSYFFIKIFEAEGEFPIDIYKNLIELEDIYVNIHAYYKRGECHLDHSEIAGIENEYKEFLERIKKYRDENIISTSQMTAINMFVCIRLGDILFYFVQYSMSVQASEVDQYSEKIIHYYNKGLDHSGLRTHLAENLINQQTEKRFTATIYNEMGALYLIIKNRFNKETDASSWKKVETYISHAVELAQGGNTPSHILAVYQRNQGAAFERCEDHDQAIDCYKKSFKNDPTSYKTAHCIASWFRKRTSECFNGKQINELIQNSQYIDEVSQEKRKEGVCYLKKSIYWFEIKDKISNQLDLQHLIDEYELLSLLTDVNYDEKITELKLRSTIS